MAKSKKGAEKRLNLFCGIDIGSRTGKVVLINQQKEILFSLTKETKSNAATTLSTLFKAVKTDFKKKIVAKAVTGYGRESIASSEISSLTEITAHYLGATLLHPEIRSIIDIGGQDSKVITIGKDLKIKDFVMNDRCAAGTGRFLEVMCERIGFKLSEFAALNIENIATQKINATCTVFAESEIISMMSRNVEQLTIASTLAEMVAKNVFNMALKVHPAAPMFMSGGVSKLKPVRDHLQKLFKTEVTVSEYSQVMGAIGAALFALNKALE
ncbi:MAG: acyl-CoA dehydratase activase [bacterium]